MSMFTAGADSAPMILRSGVLAACLAVVASFGVSMELSAQPVVTAEAVEARSAD